MLLHFNRIFVGLDEGPLNFFPTYKFDHNSGERMQWLLTNRLRLSANDRELIWQQLVAFCNNVTDQYDSSHRRRVPSWTDRILFKLDEWTQVISYCSAPDIRTSDHRPVYATFRTRIQFDNESSKKYVTPVWEGRGETRSEVCCISWTIWSCSPCYCRLSIHFLMLIKSYNILNLHQNLLISLPKTNALNQYIGIKIIFWIESCFVKYVDVQTK